MRARAALGAAAELVTEALEAAQRVCSVTEAELLRVVVVVAAAVAA